MAAISHAISDFYMNHVAPITIHGANGSYVKVIGPVSRVEFLASSGMAIFVAIHEVVQSAISLIAALFTLARNERHIQELCKHLKNVAVALLVFPLGYVGAVFPGTVNKYVIGIPERGYRTQVSGLAFS